MAEREATRLASTQRSRDAQRIRRAAQQEIRRTEKLAARAAKAKTKSVARAREAAGFYQPHADVKKRQTYNRKHFLVSGEELRSAFNIDAGWCHWFSNVQRDEVTGSRWLKVLTTAMVNNRGLVVKTGSRYNEGRRQVAWTSVLHVNRKLRNATVHARKVRVQGKHSHTALIRTKVWDLDLVGAHAQILLRKIGKHPAADGLGLQ